MQTVSRTVDSPQQGGEGARNRGEPGKELEKREGRSGAGGSQGKALWQILGGSSEVTFRGKAGPPSFPSPHWVYN